MERKEPLDNILSYLPPRVRSPLERSRGIFAPSVHEIALRADRPLCIYCADGRYTLTASGCLIGGDIPTDALTVSSAELSEVFLRLCDYSVYSRQDELIHGYLTAPGGARIGVCGAAVIRDGSVVNIRNISTLSFRVPREVKGCCRQALELIRPLRGVLVCGAPCTGKTTFIRDLARTLSYTYKVSVIDERGELSAAGGADCGCDTGLCDVYLRHPKGEGVMDAVRTMAPDIIVCDELGDEADVAAVRYALRCGVAFIASVHAAGIDDLRSRAVMRELLQTGAFGYLVFLSERRFSGKVSRIYSWGDADA